MKQAISENLVKVGSLKAVREVTVYENDTDQRLDRFLQKAFPNLSLSLSQKLIRKKRIKVNNARTEANYRLQAGDVIKLYLSDELLASKKQDILPKADKKFGICYEDEQIIILEKPPNIPCHSNQRQGETTLVDMLKSYLYESGAWDPKQEQSFVPALSNRLDRNTGGLVLAGKTAAAQKMLNEKIRLQEIEKYYLLAVYGLPNPPKGTITGNLTKDGEKNQVRVTGDKTEGKQAITEYETIETKGDLSLVQCKLITGRSHQIRVHMQSLGTAILGDRKYGADIPKDAPREKQQALWAYQIRFAFTTDAGVLEYLKGKNFISSTVPFVQKYFEN